MTEFFRVLSLDFERSHDPLSRSTLIVFRFGQAARRRRGPVGKILQRAAKMVNFLWNRLLVGCDLPAGVTCGPGLLLMHGGRGIVVNAKTVIGDGVTLLHGVTLGAKDRNAGPRLGNGVVVGNGASILGPITVGEGARIGAHAVVLHDVPPGATAVGVPARIIV